MIFGVAIVDSCDFKINEEVPKMTQYLKKDMQRPCFDIEIYFQKLQQLQQMYPISTVYLATDSLEMISRTKKEKNITWIYLDIERNHFDKRFGEIQCRGSVDNYLSFFSAISDILLLRNGDLFLVSKFIHTFACTFL